MEVLKSTDADFEKLLADNKKVIVKYHAAWCGSCRLIAPKYKNLANAEGLEDVIFLEVDAEHNKDARAKAGVNNLPFFAGFKDGALIEGFPSSKIEAVETLAKSL